MDKNTELHYIKEQIVKNHKRMSIGNLGEKLVGLVLPDGWLKYQERTPFEGDMRIYRQDTGEILTLEIKASKRGKRGDWQFCLNKSGHTSCSHVDYVILLCVCTSGLIVPFVIPAPLVKHTSSISIRTFPTDYRGKYSPFRQSLNRLNFEVSIS